MPRTMACTRGTGASLLRYIGRLGTREYAAMLRVGARRGCRWARHGAALRRVAIGWLGLEDASLLMRLTPTFVTYPAG